MNGANIVFKRSALGFVDIVYPHQPQQRGCLFIDQSMFLTDEVIARTAFIKL
jgi:hypothetical protein